MTETHSAGKAELVLHLAARTYNHVIGYLSPVGYPQHGCEDV